MHKTNLPSLKNFKIHAKLLRAVIGKELQHGKALILLSHQYGYSDWNILKPLLGTEENNTTTDDLLEYTIKAINKYKSEHNIEINKDLSMEELVREVRRKNMSVALQTVSLDDYKTDHGKQQLSEWDILAKQVRATRKIGARVAKITQNIDIRDTLISDFRKKHPELWYKFLKKNLLEKSIENIPMLIEDDQGNTYQVTDRELFLQNAKELEEHFKNNDFEELEKYGIKRFLIDNEKNRAKEMESLRNGRFDLEYFLTKQGTIIPRDQKEHWMEIGIGETGKGMSRLASEDFVVDISGMNEEEAVSKMAEELLKVKGVVLAEGLDIPEAARELRKNNMMVMYIPEHINPDNFINIFKHFRSLDSKAVQVTQRLEDFDPKYWNFPPLKKGDGFMMIDSKADAEEIKGSSHTKKKPVPAYVKQFGVDKKPSR